MTEHEQRVAIAEWMGVAPEKREPSAGGGFEFVLNPTPNYVGDLNAIHDAEARLSFEQRIAFTDHLRALTRPPDLVEHFVMEVARLVHASAAQRAEALLRTLGLWKEPTP